MKGVTTSRPGGPEVLVYGEVTSPKVRAGEVLIRVYASGVNGADLLQREGMYAPPEGEPWCCLLSHRCLLFVKPQTRCKHILRASHFCQSLWRFYSSGSVAVHDCTAVTCCVHWPSNHCQSLIWTKWKFFGKNTIADHSLHAEGSCRFCMSILSAYLQELARCWG